MPKIALVLCFAFIAYLFRADLRRKPGVSGAVWIPLIWMLIIGSRMVSEWLNVSLARGGVAAFQEGNPVDSWIFFFLYILAGIVLFRRRVTIGAFIRKNPWIFAFFLYGVISIFWSDFPVVSAKRYIKGVGNLMIAMVVLTETRPYDAMAAVIRRCSYVLVPLSIVLYKYFPAIGRNYSRWTGKMEMTGVTTNKNALGALCMVCGLSLLIGLVQKWKTGRALTTGAVRTDLLVLVMTLWLLFKCHSSTSLGCFIIGALTYWLLGTGAVKRNVKNLGTIFIIVVAAGFAVNYSMFNIFQLATSALNRNTTLTGRTDVWSYLVHSGTNPLIGCGYESYWLGRRLEALWNIYQWHPNEAHNGYLEIYLNLGWLGIFLLSGLIIAAFSLNRERLRNDFEYGRYTMIFFVISILYNITESAFRSGELVYFIFTIVIINVGGGFHHPIAAGEDADIEKPELASRDNPVSTPWNESLPDRAN